MGLWDLFDRIGERRAARRAAKLAMRGSRPGFWERVLPTEFRGWLALGLFVQTTLLFGILAAVQSLNENQGFMTLAAAVIVTGWVGGCVAFAYAAGKSSAEQRNLTDRALRVAEGAQAGSGGAPAAAADRVAGAAQAEASEIAEEEQPR